MRLKRGPSSIVILIMMILIIISFSGFRNRRYDLDPLLNSQLLSKDLCIKSVSLGGNSALSRSNAPTLRHSNAPTASGLSSLVKPGKAW